MDLPEELNIVSCEKCSAGSCLEHCEVCGYHRSVWDCDYAFPRASARPQSSVSIEFRGLPEWHCRKPNLSARVDHAVVVVLLVVGLIVLDFFLGGRLIHGNLSALWSFIFKF